MKVISLLLMSGMMSCLGFDWKIFEVEGVKYVSLDQVGEFYRLKKKEVEEGKVILMNGELALDFVAGSKSVLFNKVKFLFKEPVRKEDGLYLVSKDDLTLLIDPVLRPSKIEGVGKIETIILDVGEKGGPLGRKIEERLEKRGFKVVILGGREAPLDLAGRINAANEGPGDVYLQIIIKEGGDGVLRTSTLGNKTKASVALATGLHWGINSRPPLKLVDEGISIGDDVAFKVLGIPGVRIEGELGPEDLGRKLMADLQAHLVGSISNSLHSARSVMRPENDKPKEEK
jgi:N-acetylmuramoyl-L-alanine amidase